MLHKKNNTFYLNHIFDQCICYQRNVINNIINRNESNFEKKYLLIDFSTRLFDVSTYSYQNFIIP